ncbi:arylsulfatase : Arylsulfatase A OS=Rhodopirellula europaea SH398 GN=RESH_00626 PE=4 SV=1: Sulfatase: Sulfatase_C [Gemmataceae bacterium]|nr:arylsulfatase : Arylsulfatase A OS=Rhodopirellula europaea SH398 GN=RESH_00626 PE=4 SV=1: Sulfatase: Sulfatase_C [Gemmataceae bacterium]VTU00820.1 arylsulfatase : Arylsulfatase A OS=Rhodopirellula europaea SH398 GN=RESH_00626 PE=4 SV=1: Sulfatase: Sulfatase_C [Gemmataceae bacterium]
MLNRSNLVSVALLAAGASLGWAAATGHLSFSRPAVASTGPAPVVVPGGEAPAACCAATAPGRAALAAHNEKVSAALQKDGKKPNVLIIWGDDIGVHNISAYNHGIMGYQTPNIDRLAKEGALFTDAYGEQSCTAGRAAFILGQHPFRTGLLTIGMPGSEHGIPDWAPTVADLLKNHGYATAQYGKNHLGDRDKHLPTAHGFDEFYGNLYHLNAEEEPETYYYPKDPEFKKKYGPRGVIKSTAGGEIKDTGPLNRKRMETIDEDMLANSLDFIERQAKAGKPFFLWHNSTRMHVWTRLKKESEGKTGIGLYPDGMVEHDGHVGQLLKKLDDLGIADSTIVMYSTDNGAETASWPDGGITPFHGEKGTNWEGGHRIPLLVRWPGVFKPGTKINDAIAHNDWMPTLLAAAGEGDVKEKLAKGHKANGKEWKVKLDGYNFLPYFKGEEKKSPRNEYFYFGQQGDLNAVRYRDWKVHFGIFEGNIATGIRTQPNWPLIINLKADPYEMMWKHGEMGYLRWYADNLWLFVPAQEVIKGFFVDFDKYPYQTGSSLSPAGINYNTIKLQELLKKLQTASSPRN